MKTFGHCRPARNDLGEIIGSKYSPVRAQEPSLVPYYRRSRDGSLRAICLVLSGGPYAAEVQQLLREKCREWIVYFRRHP